MQEILTRKSSPYDFWTVNGSRSFGIFPANTIPEIPYDLPICLQRGNASWGSTHVERKHGHWLSKHKMNVGQMVWSKCQQIGSVYTTEDADKSKVSLAIFPAALLLLRFVTGDSPYFRIVTIYEHPKESLDGTIVGRFVGTKRDGPASIIAPVQLQTLVRVKPKP
jgi:hypothetical protein